MKQKMNLRQELDLTRDGTAGNDTAGASSLRCTSALV